MRYLYLVLALQLCPFVFSQNIPDSRKVDWSICGYEGEIPCIGTERNAVTEFGINNTGSSDVTAAVNAALNSIAEGEALYFPAGTYLFNGTVSVPQGRLIRGESPTATIFNFSFSTNATCIEVRGGGSVGTDKNITAVGAFGEFTVTVDNTSGLQIGDDVEIEQANDPAIHGAEDPGDLRTWAENLKGQIAKIADINGNIITLDRSLTFEYDLNFTMTLREVDLKSEVGLESFRLVRLSDNGTNAANNNFLFTYTKNCWMRRVHSEYSSRYHIRVDFSRNIEMSELFLDKAYDCGGGGAGYGILTQDHATECLFENNIARALRHPWIPKEGAARNVYAYNFSSGTTQGADCDSDPLTNSLADISLHGHYPAYNLFEGNIVYRVTSSDAWGPNGPGNTIFRNRVLGTKGIWIQSFSKEQNVIGNELTASGAQFEMDRDGTIDGTTLNYSNYGISGLIDTDAPSTVLNSYYLSAKPEFFGADAWPPIGPGVTFNSGEIPAEKRFNSGSYFETTPLCAACDIPDLGPDQSLCGVTDITLNSNLSATDRTFEWYRGTTLLPGTGTSITINTPGTYRVVSNNLGCVTEDEITITATLPSLDLGGDQVLCKPSVYTIQSSISDLSYDYQWSKDGAMISGATGTSLEVYEAGEYSLEVSTAGCSAVEDDITITSDLLDVTGDILCSSGTATVTVNGTSTYEWFDQLDGGMSLGTTTSIDVNVTANTTVYVEDTDGFSALVGHEAPDFSNGRTWDANAFDRKLSFSVLASTGLTLDSVSVWPESATEVTVRILASNNSTELHSKTFAGMVADQENRLFLDFDLDPGDYYLDLEGTNGNMYYSNDSDPTISYPYTVTDIISITGADPTWITAKPWFMYAYNWRVSAGNACDRTPVLVEIDPASPGCGAPDTDNDGTPDATDACPNDPNKAASAGQCGCGVADTDTDGDGTADCNDAFPNDFDNDGVATVDDCDDTDSNVGAATTWYADTDNDGEGDASDTQLSCSQPVGYVAVAGDDCPTDPNKTVPGACGCGVADTDTDGDGTADCNDAFPNDFDNDGVATTDDCDDADSNIGAATTWYADTDNDGLGDASDTQLSCTQPIGYIAVAGDGCPTDPNKTVPGACGCGLADTDTDGDGTADCNDAFPNDFDNDGIATADDCDDADSNVGAATTWYADTDNDGAGDASDTQLSCTQPAGYIAVAGDDCPNDLSKTAPGVCGCGVADTDTDGDGTADCNDAFPNDFDNDGVTTADDCDDTDSNVGIATTWYADFDNDNLGDATSTIVACVQPVNYVAIAGDDCPNDGNKMAPGICGCGVVDVDVDNDGVCDNTDNDLDNDGVDNADDCEPSNPAVGAATTWYADLDNDGMGDLNNQIVDCIQPLGYVAVIGDDCPNDPNKTIPGDCGCGVAEGNCDDCAGVVNGDAFEDVCGTCAGGTTGITPVTDPQQCIATGVEDNLEFTVKAYPNPFHETITIEVPERANISIHDMSGVEIMRSTFEGTIQLGHNWKSGVYVVELTGEGVHQFIKVVKVD